MQLALCGDTRYPKCLLFRSHPDSCWNNNNNMNFIDNFWPYCRSNMVHFWYSFWYAWVWLRLSRSVDRMDISHIMSKKSFPGMYALYRKDINGVESHHEFYFHFFRNTFRKFILIQIASNEIDTVWTYILFLLSPSISRMKYLRTWAINKTEKCKS